MTYTTPYFDNSANSTEGADTTSNAVYVTDAIGVPSWGSAVPAGTVFWEILTTAAGTALGDFADYGGIGDTLTTGFNAIDAGSLATVTDASTAGFTHVDLGRLV